MLNGIETNVGQANNFDNSICYWHFKSLGKSTKEEKYTLASQYHTRRHETQDIGFQSMISVTRETISNTYVHILILSTSLKIIF